MARYSKKKWAGGRISVADDGTRTFHIYKMRGGRRHSVSTRCTDEGAALKEYERWQLDPDGYSPRGGGSQLRVDAASVDAFVADGKGRGNSEGRLWRRRQVMEWWAERLTGDLRALTVERVYKLAEGAPDGERKKSVLKTYLRWLQQTGRTERNLGEGVRVVQAQPAQFKKSKVIQLGQHRKVVARLEQKYADLCVILAGTGWHLEELGRFIEAGDIKYPGARPDFPASRSGYVLVTPRHKSGDIHRTEVSEKVEEAAFRAKELGWWNRIVLHRKVKEACKDTKTAPYSPSWYRHSVATWAIEKGADPAAVSAFLGHRHPSTVKRFYATHAVVPGVPTME